MRIFCQAVEQRTPILSKTIVAQSVVAPILSNRKNAHGVFLKLYLPSKTTVAQSVLTPISSKKRVAHGVSHKLYLPNNTGQFKAKRQLRSVIWGEFRGTRKFCTTFFTGFGFPTIRVNLKQNDSCSERFHANFEQQDNCARCFGKVLDF